MNHNLEDPAIRNMILANHVPEEIMRNQNAYGTGGKYIDEIRCMQCNVTWPCEPISRLRSWEHENDLGS